ncbi:hypothetical protein [Streptomyces sp. CA-111067]|uniref:hypothetical protein n=1 Tax=Streptomyces sp. CA-111067 TaxID=3240046 RepID=UPI003D978185
MTTTAPITLTPKDFEATYDDIAVCCSGEDGDMIALGHHDPTTALAAFNRHATEYLGLANIVDDATLPAAELASYAKHITQHWGTVRKATEAEQDNEGWSWCLESAIKDTPGAIPYTWLGLN